MQDTGERFEPSVGSLVGLGPLESDVMGLLWQRREATVAEVAGALDRPLAYTTVMTIMSRLAAKGLLRRKILRRAYVYEPAKTVEEYKAELARDRVRELIRNFGDLAVTNFVEELKAADPERLRRLTEFLEERGKS